MHHERADAAIAPNILMMNTVISSTVVKRWSSTPERYI
jgi:hypothetical protein